MKLILCGGGSGEQNVLANNKLNEIVNSKKPILYIPLAMNENEHPYDGCYEWINEELSSVEVSHIDMVRSFDELATKKLEEYTALFIGGGNTYKLLLGLKQSGSFEMIKSYIQNGGIVIGGSAGAVIFGKDIDIISSMDPNDVNLTDTKGFDMLSGISIFPHYMNRKSKLSEEENQIRMDKFTESIIEFSLKKGPVLAIPEEDAIYVDDNNIEIIGIRNYFCFKDGNQKEYKVSCSINENKK